MSLSRVSWWLFLGLCQCQLQTSPTQQHQRENIKKTTARTRTRSAGPSRRCMQIHPYAWGGQHLEEKLQQNWRVCIMRVCTHTHTATPLPASRACMCARSVINYLARSAPHNMEQAHMCVCVCLRAEHVGHIIHAQCVTRLEEALTRIQCGDLRPRRNGNVLCATSSSSTSSWCELFGSFGWHGGWMGGGRGYPLGLGGMFCVRT